MTFISNAETKLAQKKAMQQELELEIKDSKFRLEYVNFEINNLKDAIIQEYQESLDEKDLVSN